MKYTTLSALAALAALGPVQASTWSGHLNNEYHSSGVVGNSSTVTENRSGRWTFDYYFDYPDDDDKALLVFLDNDYEGSPAPWQSHEVLDYSGLREDWGVEHTEGTPYFFDYANSASVTERFSYGNYSRTYFSWFSVDVRVTYDGSNWTNTGTWEYNSELIEESGKRPALPEGGPGLAVLSALLGATSLRRRR